MRTPEQIMFAALAAKGWDQETGSLTLMQGMEIALAALAAEGWSLHRLDDYEHATVDGVTFAEENPEGKDGLIVLVDSRPWTPQTMRGTYALVPVESGETE